MWIRALINHILVMILLLPNLSSPNNGFPLHSEYKTNAFIRYKKFQMIWIHRYDCELILHYFYSGTHQSFKKSSHSPVLLEMEPLHPPEICFSVISATMALSWHSGLCSVSTSLRRFPPLPICPRSTTRYFYPLALLYFSSEHILPPSYYAACSTVCLLPFIRM